MRTAGWLLVAALLVTCCAAQCAFGPTEEASSAVDLRGWVELPTGSGSWSVSGDEWNTASQRYSGISSFLVSDFELPSSQFLRFSLRAGREDGLIGFVAGLTCLPEHSGTIFECDNELIPQVVWGRGNEDTSPGLCAQIGRFPSLVQCPIAQPQCTAQCQDMNAPVGDEDDGFGPGLPIYAAQTQFHTGFLACCDRFCDGCGEGLGWIADQVYDVVVQYLPGRLNVFFNGSRLFNYMPSLTQEASMPSTTRVAVATKSHADVDFSSVQLLNGGTVACAADPWTAVQTLITDGCSDNAHLTIDYGDGRVVRASGLQESYQLSHTYADAPANGYYSVRLTLDTGERIFYKTIDAYVREPLSIGIRAVPQGTCGFSGACHSPYGELELDYATGGSPPYTIVWSASGRIDTLSEECFDGPCNLDSLSNLQPGDYTATVTDRRGCTAVSDVVTITVSSVSITSMTETTCGDIDVAVSYTARCTSLYYEWSTSDGTAIADPHVASPSALGPGTYTVTVTDANYCSDTASKTLSFGITNYHPGEVIVSGVQGTVSWEGYPRYTDGTVSLACPDRTIRLYSGDLHDVTTASYIVSGGSSGTCSLAVTANSGCVSSVSPIYYCLSTEYNHGQCPPYQGMDDDDFH